MTHSCKTVLKQIVKLSNKSCVLLCIYQKSSIKEYGTATDKEYITLNRYEGELKSIIQTLIENGYLEAPYKNTFQLTHKGLHYNEYKFEEIKSFMLRSIFTPIVVSFTTTLLTLLLTWLLSGQ